MQFVDYYKELGLEKGATEEEIKKAFRRLARQYHPDANPDDPTAEEKFKKISEAYEVLGDPQKRAKYDQIGSQFRSYQNGGGSGWQDFGRQRQYEFTQDDLGDMFTGTSFGDLLSQLFGGSRPKTEGRRPGTRNKEHGTRNMEPGTFKVPLTLEEAFDGVTKRLLVDGKKVDVTFKPGVASGQKLSLGGGTLEVQIKPHARFSRDGDDLRVVETIPFTTAALGGTHRVQTLSGTVNMSIPAGTTSGRTLRLKGQGMPNYDRPSTRGDLYVTFHVEVPSTLTDEQRQLVEQLKGMGL
jgi:curved DNA-binding protein